MLYILCLVDNGQLITNFIANLKKLNFSCVVCFVDIPMKPGMLVV